MGRPAKSVHEHELHGTKRQVKEPSGFVGGRPKYPKHLSPDAKKAYKHAVALLEARHTLTEGEESLLAVYATVYARWIEAKSELVGKLFVQIPLLDSNGQVHFVERPNPRLKIASECETKLLAITKTLGLSPTDRERSKPTAGSDSEKTDEQLEAERLRDWFNKPKEISWRPPAPIAPPAETENEDE
jgi:P27 family predicted phage terminase small subunit